MVPLVPISKRKDSQQLLKLASNNQNIQIGPILGCSRSSSAYALFGSERFQYLGLNRHASHNLSSIRMTFIFWHHGLWILHFKCLSSLFFIFFLNSLLFPFSFPVQQNFRRHRNRVPDCVRHPFFLKDLVS
jgi:hypothetical protein